jgi:hypothetical protein
VAVCLGIRGQQWEALEVDQVGGTARGRVHRLGKLLPGWMWAAVPPRLWTLRAASDVNPGVPAAREKGSATREERVAPAAQEVPETV